MSKAKIFLISLVATLVACNAENVETVADEKRVSADSPKSTATTKPKQPVDEFDGTIGKPGAPYSISYKTIGTAVVGNPLTIELTIRSSLGPQPVNVDYRINDSSSMVLAEAQPRSVRLEPAANESSWRQQVTIIPQREGRLYLNVSASFQTEDGSQSTVAAIPIQVGQGTRRLQENGTVDTDEDGEAIKILEGS